MLIISVTSILEVLLCPNLTPISLVQSETEPPGKPKNTTGGSLSLLQWIFWTQESSQGLLHCRRILYQLSYQGSPLVHKINAILASYTVDYFGVLKFSINWVFYRLSHIICLLLCYFINFVTFVKYIHVVACTVFHSFFARIC